MSAEERLGGEGPADVDGVLEASFADQPTTVVVADDAHLDIAPFDDAPFNDAQSPNEADSDPGAERKDAGRPAFVKLTGAKARK